MSKADCQSAINNNTQLITNYQAQIVTLNNEIIELTSAKNKVENLKSKLAECKSTGITRLANTATVNHVNQKITGSFVNNMSSLFNGDKYTTVWNSLNNGSNTIADEIQAKQKIIADLNTNIGNCNAAISSLQSQIAAIEQEEAAAAAAAAAQEAANRQAAAAAAQSVHSRK